MNSIIIIGTIHVYRLYTRTKVLSYYSIFEIFSKLRKYFRTSEIQRCRAYLVLLLKVQLVLYVIRKNPPKNVLVTKYTYKSVRANTRARNTTITVKISTCTCTVQYTEDLCTCTCRALRVRQCGRRATDCFE